MMRNYGYCVHNGYSSDDYAGSWADDLYNQLLESAYEAFWGNHQDVPEKYETEIEIPEALESALREQCYDAYQECYERYESELEDALSELDANFEEYEVDDASWEVIEGLTGSMVDQLEKIAERDGFELKQ